MSELEEATLRASAKAEYASGVHVERERERERERGREFSSSIL